jgi:hypothetical protein
MKLDGSIISLEFAPLSKGITITNIPQGTCFEDIRFKFSNKNIGGDQVTDMMLDRTNGIANVYFEKTSGMNLAYFNTIIIVIIIIIIIILCSIYRPH